MGLEIGKPFRTQLIKTRMVTLFIRILNEKKHLFISLRFEITKKNIFSVVSTDMI